MRKLFVVGFAMLTTVAKAAETTTSSTVSYAAPAADTDFQPPIANRLVAASGTGPPAPADSWQATATGASAARTLADRFNDIVNIKDFGAACNGTTDDTSAINNALAYAASKNRDIRLPSGTCVVSDTLVHSGSGSITGQGSQSTILKWKTGVSGTGKAILRLAGRTTILRGFQLAGSTSYAPDTGLDVYPSMALIAQMHVIEDVWIGTAYPPGTGLWSHDPPGGSQHEMITVRNSRISGRSVGVKFDKRHDDLWSFCNCYIGHTDAAGASFREVLGDGMGLELFHTWLIGPNIGFDFQGGGFADIYLHDSGSEGPRVSISVKGTQYIDIYGQGVGSQVKVAANASLILTTHRTQWFMKTTGAPVFDIDPLGSVHWDSDRDSFWLDGTVSQDLEAVAQAAHRAGYLVFSASQFNRRVFAQPVVIGGPNTAYFYSPTSQPELMVQPGFSSSPALRLKKTSGTVQFEVAESLGSTGQTGVILSGVRMFTGTAAPRTGTWLQGDIVYNTTPSEAGSRGSKYVVTGWICTAGGTPGTWVPMRAPTGN